MAGYSFYKLPLQVSAIMQGKEVPVYDHKTSITKNIELIIMTRYGELRGEPTFGCEIWDLDFELIISHGLWEKKVCSSVLDAIRRHESRLSDCNAQVLLTEVERLNPIYNHPEVKKKVEIRLTATIRKTGEPYHFVASLFLSPLSID